MVAEVIIDTSVKTLNKTFDYEIPTDLEIKVGSRVFVPFGNQKVLAEGIVVNIKEKSEFKIKPISGLQEEQIADDYLELSKFMAHRYFCNIADCLRLMLPPGRTNKNIDNRIKEKKINCISLAKTREEIEEAIESKEIKSQKQIDVLEFLLNNDNSSMQDIELFTDATPAVVTALQKKGFIEKVPTKVERNPFIHKVNQKTQNYKLTDEQQKVFNEISKNLNTANEYLIFGVTGSGKTEIYLQLISKALERGKSSIMLVPEISLTPQTVDRFIARFGEENIAVLHSKLSIGERFDQWMKIKEGKAKIIIGARSAIFAPVQNLGLIVIDEEHDESYESESNPRYNAIEIAEYIKDKVGVPLVLGSATPSMKSFYKAKQDEIKLLTIRNRANKSTLPTVDIVDLRDELANGNKSMISEKLRDEIQSNLDNNQQTILFLNRRGFASFIMCRDCGETIKCDRCNITLTYHKYENKLKCHYCGNEREMVNECPNCHSKNIRTFGAGTQKLEEEIKSLFPNSTTIRMDSDTVSKKNSHEEILKKFKDENINILIGTQMVVKGHDFPNVTLVGVVAADTELNFEDFRASERTFQTLTQVAGRAGRGEIAGRVIVQTYNPEHYAIELAKTQNYEEFFDTELEVRKSLKYPPFCDIIVAEMSSKSKNELIKVANTLHAYLKDRVINEKFGVLLYSPVPSPIDKIKDRYRMRMIVKCKYDEKINDLMNGALETFYNMKVLTARLAIELNPNNML